MVVAFAVAFCFLLSRAAALAGLAPIVGASLTLPAAGGGRTAPAIDAATFGAVVIMAVVTTLVTPPVLKWSLARAPRKAAAADGR